MATNTGAPTFWSLADAQGKRCVVFDVPETFPEDDFGGKAIFEWGNWAWYGERTSQPESLIPELKERFGDYPLKMEAVSLGLKFPDLKDLEKRLLASVKHKQAVLEWLLDGDSWDLAVSVFGESHLVGHYLWPAGVLQMEDPDDPRFAAARRVYVAIDAAIGAIRSRLPEDVTLAVVSGDGISVNNCGWHLLPDVIERFRILESAATAGWQAQKIVFGQPQRHASARRQALDCRSFTYWSAQSNRRQHACRADRLDEDARVCPTHRFGGLHPYQSQRPGARGNRGTRCGI